MRKIKNFLEYLYYKYYKFQIYVGNSDVAPLFAMLIIIFAVLIYIPSILLIIIFFFPHMAALYWLAKHVNKTDYMLFVILLFICSYFLFLHKKKYKKIMKREELNEKSNLTAILFSLMSFILYVIGCVLAIMGDISKLR